MDLESKIIENANLFKSYTLRSIDQIEQINKIPKDILQEIKTVAHVFPFKANSYVLDELIDWEHIPDDPLFKLIFPSKEMLTKSQYKLMKKAIEDNSSKETIEKVANTIRMQLNPNPAGQKSHNVPKLNGCPLPGLQHKYRETLLFFPIQGQTCFAYCTFCFRWPQFVKMKDLRFASKDVDKLIEYLQENDEIQDLLFTGGDPLVMSPKILGKYIFKILEADIRHLKNIRLGTKALSFWPYLFVDDKDTDYLLNLFTETIDENKHFSVMAHVNHVNELKTEVFEKAVSNILSTKANIRTQSPILSHINDNSLIWQEMWQKQVNLGMIPYYMFVARDTGAHHYFGLPLLRAWQIFTNAYKSVSGLCRTVRGPSMSCTPGKIEVAGVTKIKKDRVIALKFLQCRNPDWVGKVFFAKYNTKATWINELEPAFSKEFFFERYLPNFLGAYPQIKGQIEKIQGEKVET